jgi:anti-sigma-K factor RskA
MAAKSTHVTYDKKKGLWQIKASWRKTPIATAKTKVAAVKKGRTFSKKNRTEFVIHNKDGRIAKKDSHGGDPRGRG